MVNMDISLPMIALINKKSRGGTAGDITYSPEETYAEGTVGNILNGLSQQIAQLNNELNGINTLVGSGEYDS